MYFKYDTLKLSLLKKKKKFYSRFLWSAFYRKPLKNKIIRLKNKRPKKKSSSAVPKCRIQLNYCFDFERINKYYIRQNISKRSLVYTEDYYMIKFEENLKINL